MATGANGPDIENNLILFPFRFCAKIYPMPVVIAYVIRLVYTSRHCIMKLSFQFRVNVATVLVG